MIEALAAVAIVSVVALVATGLDRRHERAAWARERELLLDRIQAPSFGEFKQATAAPRPRVVAQIMSDEDAYDEEQRRKGAA